jgi:predicted phosphoribosyltransferase
VTLLVEWVPVLSWSYHTRKHAGEILADRFEEVDFQNNPIVIAIPNGGIAVGHPIAERLQAEISIIIVRKLQIPYNPEAGFGAVTSYNTVILNDALVNHLQLSEEQIDDVVVKTRNQISRRREAYAGLLKEFKLRGRDVIIVDDGLASGFTMLAAVESIRQLEPATITVAVPTASASSVERVTLAVDKLLCPRIESGFVFAVANAYENWYDVSDEEVIELLKSINK